MDRLRRLPRGAVWGLGAIPLILLVADAVSGRLGIDPVRDIEHRLGRTAIYFVIASLCVTPLLRLGRVNLMKFRRPLGLLGFSYAVLHLGAWLVLDMALLWGQLLRDIAKRPYLTFGMGAFVILAILAATSSDSAIRRLGPVGWRGVHRLVYFAAPLGILHWLWAYKLWPGKGLAVGALVLALLALRLPGVSDRLRRAKRILTLQ
ncbi:MAG TPA: protein-methionine-sulfoxide reductase heme-binding subunit MsrQ [Paracoccus sp. (in: a-proteobacteria)]|nr:protein-methionine-sulfoxide reductase heme-binding subunit MsrQ [Paracoccus sp. (in: a-proteobacteria)]